MNLLSNLNILTKNSVAFFFSLFLTQNVYAKESSVLPVSIYQLIANPEKFDGKEVYVIGFMHLEFEGDVIYAHREDWNHSLIQNGIAFEVPKERHFLWMKMNNNYVAIEGTFSTTERGHFALRAGSLTKITKLVKWRNKSKP